MFERLDDTIVAVSTPMGSALRGMVRWSGPRALGLAEVLFLARDGSAVTAVRTPARLEGRAALMPGRFLLPAELYVFAAPRSYTREDVVELHTAGNPALLEMIVERVVESGARRAAPGEFTARAFLRGRLDLGTVQGIAALIRARTDGQLRAAQRWLAGHAAARVRALRDDVLELLSLVEAEIDFAEEPIEFIGSDELRRRLVALLTGLQEAEREVREREIPSRLPRVLLVGRPNAGKSALLNALCGMNRALCSPVAGCTRDFLSAVVCLPAGQAEVIDTPGCGVEGPENESTANTFFTRELARSDLICHVVDLASDGLAEQLVPPVTQCGSRVLWVANKSDLLAPATRVPRLLELSRRGCVPLVVVSAMTGDGLPGLRQALGQVIHSNAEQYGDQCVAASFVHFEALRSATVAAQQAVASCRDHAQVLDCAEYLACDLRAAADALGAVFGEVTTNDLLQRIFAGFCIGK